MIIMTNKEKYINIRMTERIIESNLSRRDIVVSSFLDLFIYNDINIPRILMIMTVYISNRFIYTIIAIMLIKIIDVAKYIFLFVNSI